LPRKNFLFRGFVLSGIMQLVDGPRAVVNDVIVAVGDVVNGAVVQKINKEGRYTEGRNAEIRLDMKD